MSVEAIALLIGLALLLAKWALVPTMPIWLPLIFLAIGGLIFCFVEIDLDS